MNKKFVQVGWKGGSCKGSALLVALLMMGMLTVLTLGISALVVREIRLAQSIIDANKAFYAAEAGVENALLGLTSNFPGFETPNLGDEALRYGAGDDDLDPEFEWSVRISNTTAEIPAFADGKPIYVNNCQISSPLDQFAEPWTKDQFYELCTAATFRKLELSETHVIPLFAFDQKSERPRKVRNFLIQYYAEYGQSDLIEPYDDVGLEKFDVLRWKLYGKPTSSPTPGQAQRTESIADFYPVTNSAGSGNPICIGTDASLKSAAEESCIFPQLDVGAGGLSEDELLRRLGNEGSSRVWSAARECYLSDAGAGVTGSPLNYVKTTFQDADSGSGIVNGLCTMSDFIEHHEENYLVLTNMTNPEVLGINDPTVEEQVRKANIYYRVLASDRGRDSGRSSPRLVKDFAEISADGFAGDDVIKSLDARYQAPGYLPVFNFSLYKTASDMDASIYEGVIK